MKCVSCRNQSLNQTFQCNGIYGKSYRCDAMNEDVQCQCTCQVSRFQDYLAKGSSLLAGGILINGIIIFYN